MKSIVLLCVLCMILAVYANEPVHTSDAEPTYDHLGHESDAELGSEDFANFDLDELLNEYKDMDPETLQSLRSFVEQMKAGNFNFNEDMFNEEPNMFNDDFSSSQDEGPSHEDV